MQQQQQSNAWIWRHLPHPAPPDGTAEVEFKPLNGIGAQERPRSFQIQGSWVELSKLKSSVTGKVYHLSYVTYTAQGGIYQATVYDNSNNPVETWAVKRMDAVRATRSPGMEPPFHMCLLSNLNLILLHGVAAHGRASTSLCRR